MSSSQPAKRPSVPKKRPQAIQEKMMFILTLFFIGGVVLYAVLPEGPVRGMSIGGFSIAMTYCLYRLTA